MACARFCSAKGVMRTDELRRAAEDLGERYSKLEYFEITTSALRTMLIEKGLITEEELEGEDERSARALRRSRRNGIAAEKRQGA